MSYEFEARIVEQVRNIVARTREEIVQTDDIARPFQQAVAQVRAEKPRAAGYQRLGIVGISGHVGFQSGERDMMPDSAAEIHL